MFGTYWACINSPNRPIANLLFLGGTGTGKTRTVEVLSEALFGADDRFTKINCAEYSHGHEVAKLSGSPPGYKGYEDTGLFEQAAINGWRTEMEYVERCKPQLSIILFDEVEKAADELWRLLLNILDKGKLSLGNNKTTDFSQSIIILTSNLGSSEMTKLFEGGFGFRAPDQDLHTDIEQVSMSAAKKHFSTEWWNRIDRAIVFRALSKESIARILSLELDKVHGRVLSITEPFCFHVSDAAEVALLSEGYSEQYGARELKRTIERQITRPLANLIHSQQVRYGDLLHITYDSKFRFFCEKGAAKDLFEPKLPTVSE